MLQLVPGSYEAAPCLFPTETLAHNERGFKSIALPLSVNVNGSKPLSRGVLLQVWAVVLRYYVGSDMICFGWIDDASEPKYAVCHGDIPAHASLDTLRTLTAESAGDSVQARSAKDWIRSNHFFNTLVWSQSSSDSNLEDIQDTQCALALLLSETPTGLQANLAYASHTIGDTIATAVAECVVRASQTIIETPGTTIGDLNLFGPSSWSKISEWNATVPETLRACMHELIDETAKRYPDRTALECWDGSVSYTELADYTSRLGNYLIFQNVGPEVLVPVCFDKSLWAVVSMLGVQKAGGAFVCIDPAQPIDRLNAIIEETNAQVALCAPAYCDMLSSSVPNAIPVDADVIHQLSPCPDLPRRALPTNAAFGTFTSGSTGKPKGIVHDHRAMCSSAKEHASRLNINRDTRTFQFAAYTFIVNTFELFTPLAEGGCVCVPSKEDRLGRTTGAMRDLNANWACLTPSFLRSISPEEIPQVKTLVLAGEPVQQDNLDTWRSRVRMLNMYGASEASVCVTGDLSNDPVERSTIGTGTGVAAWVVDATNDNQLAPIGAIGELTVEGPVLARGYLHQPEKTAAAFIFGKPWLREIRNGSPSRAYKTGDLVRLGSDGRINLVGRKDMQIKLRGQRIELEEVEFHLRQTLPRGIEVAVGLARPADQPERPLLTTFMALKKAFGDDFYPADLESAEKLNSATEGWKDRLSKAVPGYMVPSTAVKLNHMPLTASGKTNRKAIGDLASKLTVLELTGASNKKGYKEPTTATAKALRTLWAQALGITDADAISADDNFLQLGGSSIEAMKLVNLARDQNIGVSVADIFTYSQLDEMADASVHLESQSFEDIPFSLVSSQGADLDELIETAATQCYVGNSAIEDLYPCTAMQEGLMALSDSRDGAYIAHHTLSLGRNINLARFKQSCQETVTAHPILRTRFIYPEGSGALQAVLRGKIEWQSGESLDSYMKDDKQRPMRAGDALTRYGIVPDDNDGWTFIWTVHHAVYDAWTLDLLFDRLDKAYKGQAPAQDRTFKEFMTYVVNTDSNAGRQFWTEYLSGATRNEFPSTVSMSKQPVADASLVHDMAINTSNADELSGITLASMIRAAWGVLIGSHSESDDVVFGNIVSGRNAPVSNADQLFGPGIAAVPVRIKFPDSNTSTIRDFLGNVQTESAKMIAFEQTGLQNISRVSADASAACDFQTLLVVQPAKEQRENTDDVDLRAVSEADAAFGTYAITLECTLRSDGVQCAAHYDSSLVEGEQIRRILYQLENLLQQISTSQADKKVSELDFLSTYDKNSISEWNKSIPPPVNQTIHELIEKQIAERPDHEAICAWDGSFTYDEVDRHSARLTQHLQQLGVQPEMYIPCCFEKSRWAPVAMLGILRSGAAFFNVDPGQPANRIQLMIKKLQSTIIVRSPEQYELCRGMGDEYTVVVLSDDSPEPVPESTTTIPAEVKPENAAYVIFTSGSTGEPKGTVITHGAFASGSLTHSPAMLMDGNTRALQFASWTFDASIVETLTVFITGGCICIPSEEQRKRDVTECVRATRANWAALTPSFINLVKPDDVPSVKVLILAGEAMSQSHVETWGHRVRLVNGYGPSECCVASVTNIDVKLGASPRNIGYVCSGVAWVTIPHDHRLLAPVGSVGELVLEGWNAGRGYLNEPEKTAAAFVENPLWLDLPGQQRPSVVYKTGDLVAYNADGSLSFQRRKDTQVKLRGQRVELGEIEYRIKQNLSDHPDTIVDILSPKDAPDQPRLVAFLPLPVAAEDPNASIILPTAPERHLTAVSGLEDRLADFLPMHMIPSAYVPVSQIPKLPSGKADRKTLKRCGSDLTHRQMAEYSGATEDVRPPTTETQCIMQQLWVDTLKMPLAQISLNDNFMRLGGDSIAAMRLASAARARGFPLSTGTVFQHPTLEAMSEVAEAMTASQQQRELSFEPFSNVESIMPKDKLLNEVVLPQVGVLESAVQDVLQSTDFQTLAINGGLNQTRGWSNYLVFDFDGPIDLRRLEQACTQLLTHHSVLRTVFVTRPESEHLLQVVLKHAGTPEYSLHYMDDDEEDPTEALVRQDLARTPHLGEPIVRFMLIKNGATKHRLIMRVSHAQYDGASMPLLMQDLRAAYRGQPLPKRPQFRDFLRMQLYSNDGAEQFFSRMLAGSEMTAIINPATKKSANVMNTMIMEMIPFVAFRNHGITAATVVKAAWALVLAELAATSDVVYGHMVSGRNLTLDGVEAVMGPCLNIVPVRANMNNMSTILDLLQTIQQQQTDTIPHEIMGFRQIIDKCTNWPSGTRFSSVFQYQEFSGGDELAPGQSVPVEGVLKCAPGFICPAPDACDLSILATPVNNQNVVRVEMIFSNHAMSREFAEYAMKRLAMKVEMIAQNVEASLSVEELCAEESRIPLAELAMSNGEVNDSFVQSMVNGINGVSAGVNGVHEEEPDDHSVGEDINLLASVSMN